MGIQQAGRNNFFFKLIAAIVFITAAPACSKENDYESLTVEQKLTYSNWKVSDVQIGRRISVLDTCDSDNVISLSPDSSAFLERGVLKCDSWEPRMEKGNWYLKDNNKTLSLLGQDYELAVLQKEYLRMWLRDYVINSDTMDVYFMFNAVPR